MNCHSVSSIAVPSAVEDIIGNSRVAICLADTALADTPIVLLNDAFCDATGYSPEEALGRNCRFLQPPGGAGPVRGRMRQFLEDPAQDDGRFVVPNVSGDGTPFLNVVFMAKIRTRQRSDLILGSQFRVEPERNDAAAYEAALRTDLQSLNRVLADDDWAIAGSMEILSNTMALVVRHRLEA